MLCCIALVFLLLYDLRGLVVNSVVIRYFFDILVLCLVLGGGCCL